MNDQKPINDESCLMSDSPISSKMLLWRVSYGRISSKPIAVIDLGDGNIKAADRCIIKQLRDGLHESYHSTYKEAVLRLLTNAQRDVNCAKKELDASKRRLSAAKSKWSSYLASPTSNP